MSSAVDHLKIPLQLAGLILQILEEQGVSPETFLRDSRVHIEDLREPESAISYFDMLSLIERAIDLSPTPDLGLRVGARENISTWGMLGYAIMSCATERQANQVGIEFFQAGPSMLVWSLEEENGYARLKLAPYGPTRRALRFLVEENMAGSCAVSSVLMNRKVRPLEVRLSYAKPDYAEAYSEFFDCPVYFDQPGNSMLMDTWTDRPLRNADPTSAALCRKLVENLVKRYVGEEDLILRIRKSLLRTPGSFPSMEEIAAELSLSSRTLRRQLSALDTSFNAILADVQKNLAIDYLKNSNLNIDQIGAFLGYTEATNFRRAFRKWSGNPPSFYRRERTHLPETSVVRN